MVANLVDNYLAEVASDVNLKLEKFQSLAATVPDYARPRDDGIYHAVDIYLKVRSSSELKVEIWTGRVTSQNRVISGTGHVRLTVDPPLCVQSF
ncbi:putative NPH3 domain-containing protein [Helianthus annuus]|nr:putative NPH3 domain-containing protein [Helianthus annuus]